MKTMITEKPMDVTWTDDQWKAIFAKDQDILVAAAAGSGKTAVLVERIIQRIIADEHPLNVDEILVVTFTNAAAAEMRQRIGVALESIMNEQPTSSHLRRQLHLLNNASISTLHSFCLNVVRKHYYMIDIDPGFRIADDTEIALLRDEVLDELFEEEYGLENSESFYHLVDTYTNDRNDAALQELIIKLFDFSRSHPNPFSWLGRLIDLYDVSEQTDINQLDITKIIKLDIALQLTGAKRLIEQALEISKLPGGPAPRAENYLDDLQVIDSIEKATHHSWDDLYEAMNQWSFTRAKSCRGDEYDSELIKQADDLRKKAKSILDDLKKELFSRRPENYLKDMQQMKPVIMKLAEIVKKFTMKFNEKKAEKALVDFSDLEHLALQILAEQLDDNLEDVRPSEIALEYKHKFKEILIDEYQDVNLVQETIIKLIAEEGEYDGNLFMVGDVKQSIYRFRLAEPNLFLGKYNRFTVQGENTGLRIDLARNFRSRSEVLDATNYLFKQIMGTEVGEIEYSQEAELVNGANYPKDEQHPVELLMIDQSDDALDSDVHHSEANEYDQIELEQSNLEAKLIAKKIRTLIDNETTIYDTKTGGNRTIRYQDIVILLRSMTTAPEIIDELKHAGIPAYADLKTGYFSATEVSLMMSLLKVIDNPDQDIPLAGVLRSPIVGLNEDELAYIRLQSKKTSFYLAMKKFITIEVESGYEEAKAKVARFYQNIQRWRDHARTGALSKFIWQLYRETNFYEFVGGLPGGKQRQANLRALYDRARQYEATSFRGLFRFLRFIERMQDRGKDLGAARALGEQEDVVRIMTIHASKGLEFPVVIVGGIGRKFNTTDLYSSYLFDKELGFASKYINVEKRISFPSLPQLAFKRKKKMELLAEEMRVLYVAMTRAKEKLLLIGSVKNASQAINKWMQVVQVDGYLLPEHNRASANSYLDWIGQALIRHKDAEALRKGKITRHIDDEIYHHPSHWNIELIPKTAVSIENESESNDGGEWLELIKAGNKSTTQTEHKDEIYDRLHWSYHHPLASNRMSKQSVSELKRMFETRDENSDTAFMNQHHPVIFKRPKFMKEQTELSPAERGTAMHIVMQNIPLDQKPTIQSIEAMLDRLLEKELMTPEQAEAISIQQIATFFESDIGQMMIQAKKVHREVPFTLGIPAKDIYEAWDGSEEKVLVQGIIDCVIETDNGVVILDYKTDTIAGKYPGGFPQAQKILENRYRMQLSFYENAVRDIWQKNIIGTYLYFFDSGDVLQMS